LPGCIAFFTQFTLGDSLCAGGLAIIRAFLKGFLIHRSISGII